MPAIDAKPTVLVYRSDILPQSETFIKEQMLACKAWHCVLVGRRLVHQLTLEGLDVQLLEAGGRHNPVPTVTKIMHHLGRFAAFAPLRKMRPRLLHAHFGPEAVSAEPLARALQLPMLVTLHGYDINIDRDWWERGGGGPAMRRYPRDLVQLASRPGTHFLAVSDAVRARAIDFGIPARKLTTHHIGVDTAKFMPGPVPLAERSPRVLFVGRLVEKKGCEYLIQAMRIVRAQFPEAELRIIGDGPLRTQLEEMAGEAWGSTKFCGALQAEKVRAELDDARIFCLPSVRAANGDAEGFGLVLLEAQAAGLPVVSSAFGGAVEGLQHGTTGYRFEEKNVEMLADALIELLANPGKAAAMGAAARRFVSAKFDIRHCTEKLERHYNQLARSSDNVLSHHN